LDDANKVQMAAKTFSSLKTKMASQLTKLVAAYQHCDHLLHQQCLKAFLFAVS
jgi:hypothetical protein